MLPLCCSAGNDLYAHAVSRQEMYAWAARAGAATVISNLGPDNAVWYFFYGAVNAGDRYFEFELTVW